MSRRVGRVVGGLAAPLAIAAEDDPIAPGRLLRLALGGISRECKGGRG